MNTNNNWTTLATYKFYDHKYRRLAIFGIPTHSPETDDETPEINAMKIFVVTCSKKDDFERRAVRKAFESRLFGDGKFSFVINRNLKSRAKGGERIKSKEIAHPQVFLVPCTEETTKKVFMFFCHSNYFVKDTFMLDIAGKTITIDGYFNTTHPGEAILDDSSLKIKRTSESVMEVIKAYKEKGQAAQNLSNTVKDTVTNPNPNINPNLN